MIFVLQLPLEIWLRSLAFLEFGAGSLKNGTWCHRLGRPVDVGSFVYHYAMSFWKKMLLWAQAC